MIFRGRKWAALGHRWAMGKNGQPMGMGGQPIGNPSSWAPTYDDVPVNGDLHL